MGKKLTKEEISKKYKEIGVKEENMTEFFGEANICVQLFGHSDEFDYEPDEVNTYTIQNYMPRKERVDDLTFDVSDEEGKRELEETLMNSIERMKIAGYLMQQQLNELRETGRIQTNFYYWEL